MNKTFGQVLKQARLKADKTQDQLCEAVKQYFVNSGESKGPAPLNQPTLSAWENDQQKPSKESAKVLEALRQTLKISSGVFQNALKEAGRREEGIPDDDYADDVEKWVKLAKAKHNPESKNPLISEPPRIWFIAPNVLPAFLNKTDRLFNLWMNNILQGIHYKMLWILEEITDEKAFRELNEHLSELRDSVEEKIKKLGSAATKIEVGRVEVYLIKRPKSVKRASATPPDDLRRMDRDFKGFCEEWNNHSCKWILWKDLDIFGEKEDGEDQKVYGLIEGVNSRLFGRLAAYLGPDSSKAGLLLTNTSARIDGEVGRIYRWLGESSAKIFLGVVDEIEHYWNKLSPPKT